MKQVLIALCVLATTVGAAAQDWVIFGSNEHATAAYDPSSIQPDPRRQVGYLVWWRTVLASPAAVDGRRYDYWLAQYRVDCMNRGLQQERRMFFTNAGVQVASDGATGAGVAQPGTLGESFVNAVCARFGR